MATNQICALPAHRNLIVARLILLDGRLSRGRSRLDHSITRYENAVRTAVPAS